MPVRVDALHWYATDEDEAIGEAGRRARSIERDLAPLAASTKGEAGNADPVQAVEDALASFSPDEIVVAGGAADHALENSLEGFGVPVTRIGLARLEGPQAGSRELARGIMSGRSGATPHAIFATVMAFMLVVVLVIALIGLLVLWLG